MERPKATVLGRRADSCSVCGMVEEWLETTFSDDFVKKLRCRDSGVDVDVEDKVLISCYGHGYSDLFGRKRRI